MTENLHTYIHINIIKVLINNGMENITRLGLDDVTAELCCALL